MSLMILAVFKDKLEKLLALDELVLLGLELEMMIVSAVIIKFNVHVYRTGYITISHCYKYITKLSLSAKMTSCFYIIRKCNSLPTFFVVEDTLKLKNGFSYREGLHMIIY